MTRIYTPATRLDDDLWLLDLNFQGEPGVIASYLITGPQGHTLIETGPGSTLNALEHAVSAAGARLEDVTQLVVTHIHLDHAGAAGALLRRVPEARLLVHPVGAPHMIDPSRLIRSATRIYGDRMDVLWGAFEPCPAERVTLLADGQIVTCGWRTLRALHTPGHAWHHIAFHDASGDLLFTGDVGGVRIPGAHIVRPPTPPPDIDVEAWHASIDRMLALAPKHLLMTHFGRFDDPERHLGELRRRLDEWTEWVRQRLELGDDADAIAQSLRERNDADVVRDTSDATLAVAYELATPSRMTVDGLARYVTKRYPRP